MAVLPALVITLKLCMTIRGAVHLQPSFSKRSLTPAAASRSSTSVASSCALAARSACSDVANPELSSKRLLVFQHDNKRRILSHVLLGGRLCSVNASSRRH